jgi:hypothetical protein
MPRESTTHATPVFNMVRHACSLKDFQLQAGNPQQPASPFATAKT